MAYTGCDSSNLCVQAVRIVRMHAMTQTFGFFSQAKDGSKKRLWILEKVSSASFTPTISRYWLFWRKNWFDLENWLSISPHFSSSSLNDFLYQPISKRNPGIKIHSKTILILQSNLEMHPLRSWGLTIPRLRKDFKSKIAGFCYVGSANFTQSGWGTIHSLDKRVVVWNPKNWELGLSFPVTFEDVNGVDMRHSLVRGLFPYRTDFQQYSKDDVAWVSQQNSPPFLWCLTLL